MSKEVTFKIGPDGSKVEVEAEGFTGGGCLDFAKRTLDALGKVTDKKDKPEMYLAAGSGIKIKS